MVRDHLPPVRSAEPEEIATLKLDEIEVKSYMGRLVKGFQRRVGRNRGLSVVGKAKDAHVAPRDSQLSIVDCSVSWSDTSTPVHRWPRRHPLPLDRAVRGGWVGICTTINCRMLLFPLL